MMPTNAYFARYQYQPNANLIIVPTVSLCPPPPHRGTDQIAEPTTSTPTLIYEQITPAKDNIGDGKPCASPCRSNCNQQNLQVMCSNTSTSTEFSDILKNSLCVIQEIQDKISIEAPAFNKSQSIKDLFTSKYKSRHNLVDLTGFNLPKRESTSSLPKHNDLRQIDDTKIEQDKKKTSYDVNKNLNYSDSDSYKTVNKAKESSTSEIPTSTHSERNTENLGCGEPTKKIKEMEGKMKKYFKQLCSFDKLKDKAAEDKHCRGINSSSKTRQEYKDSKDESSRGKANLQKVSNSDSRKDLRNKIIESSRGNVNSEKVSDSNSTKDLRNKETSRGKTNIPKVSNSNSIKDLRNKLTESSKKYRDLERKFMVSHELYTKRSRSETNSRHLPDSKVSLRERKTDLSYVNRHKDFQRSIRQNDDNEIKYKSGNKIKTENLPRTKIRKKSCETTENKPAKKKKIDERRKSIKSEKRSKVNTNQTDLERVKNCTDMERAIDQNNTDRVKLIKSVVRVDKNVHNNLSQSKRVRSCTPSGLQDLRLRLSRKRTKSEYFGHYREPMQNRLDQQNHTIKVKQDVKDSSKNSLILAPTVKKPKPKKCKKIKLIINIECPNYDSDSSDQDLNECCSLSEDLSFLDDLNIDEIVDSLNNSQVEPNKIIAIDSDYENNEQTKPKEGLINYVNMKAIKTTMKEETNSHKEQVIEINSNTEDNNINIEIGSVANTKKCKDKQNMEENSKVDRNTKQEAKYTTDLIVKGYEENASKETIDLCKDEQNIKTSLKVGRNTMREANFIIDLTENGYEKNAPKETIDLCKDEPNIKTNSRILRNTKQEANIETDFNGNAANETMNLSDDDSVVEMIDISDENEHYTTSNLQPIKPIQTSTLAKKVNLAKSKFQFKPSFNKRTALDSKNSHDTQHEDKTDITNKQKLIPTNITDKKQTAALQTNFKIEQNESVNSIGVQSDVIKQLNTLGKEENDNSHNSEDTVEALLETMFNNCEQNGNIRKHIELKKINGCDKNVKENSIQKSVDSVEVSLETIFKTKHQDTGINMDIEQPSSGQHIQKEIDVLQIAQVLIKVPLETINNIVDQKKNLNEIEIELSNVTDIGIKIESESQKPINQKSVSISKTSLETHENIQEKVNNKMDIIPLCRSSKNFKEHLETVNKPIHKPINNIKKKTVTSLPESKNELQFDSGNSTKGTLETAKSFAGNSLNLGQNNKLKGEIIKTSKATIDNGEQNINIRSESNKNIEEKILLTLENSEVKSEKSPERSNIQHNANVTTSVELTNTDKNIEVTSISKAENSLTANNKETTLTSKKSNVENQTKSETVINNTQKLETIDAITTIKDSELGKRSEMATNKQANQQQVVSNISLVPSGSNNNLVGKATNKQAEIFTPAMHPFVSKLESRMSEYLQKKYTFSSVIHKGRFSTIYKCFDSKGETYAVKVAKQRKIGMFMEGLLFQLQQYRSRQDSFVLYLMSAFEVDHRWCLLTEYYPKNLKQALHGYTHGFHIDQVQALSRQLVDAVNMLTNGGVIHSDIKPTHILLNSTHDRLKLCGFEQSNFSSCSNITPSTGTPSYRAPEVILGFQEDQRIDIWSTALVMFEMATNKTLFMEGPNNVILYQQLCTFGSVDYTMLEQSRFGAVHFTGTSFIRKFRYNNYEDTTLVHFLQRNNNLHRILFQSYEGQLAQSGNKLKKDIIKLKLLHILLRQMLVLDPRNRLPIQFVGTTHFMKRR